MADFIRAARRSDPPRLTIVPTNVARRRVKPATRPMKEVVVRSAERVRMTVGRHVLTGALEGKHAPSTCAAFRALLPLRAKLLQARWSGEAAWVPLGALDVGVGSENETRRPRPGQLLLYPGGKSETEILVPYGLTTFAAKSGPLSGNHFLTLDANPSELAEIGRIVLWEGAQDVAFELIEAPES